MTEPAFVYVGTGGWGQLATALAQQERDHRDFGCSAEIVTADIDTRDRANGAVGVLREGEQTSETAPHVG